MTEILVNTSPRVNLDVSGANTLDAAPVVTVSYGEENVSATPQQETIPAGLADRWSIVVPLDATQLQQDIKVTWVVQISSTSYTIEQNYEVVVPFVSPVEAAERLGFSLSPTASNYRPEAEILAAERVARMVIETYTGTRFGSERRMVSAYGTDTDLLWIGEPIIQVDAIEENNTVIWDRTGDNSFSVEVTETGEAIRVSDPGDISEYTQESIGSLGSYTFKIGSRYEVFGTYGYAFIPSRIQEATMLLINDFLCQDSNWRSRYVKRAEMRDWKFTFSLQAFYGTGNALADKLLEEYRDVSMLVI